MAIRTERIGAVSTVVTALGLLGALAPVGPWVGSAVAAPVTVSVTSSADDGSPGTLRWAVDQVNASAPGDTVTVEVAAGTYVLSACGAGQDDTNVAGDLDARPGGALVVTAVGGAVTIQQTCVGERVLDVLPAAGAAPGDPSAPVTLTGMTITGGNVIGDGGGVHVAGDVMLTDVTIEANAASGPAAVPAGSAGADVRGGGLAATGFVRVRGGGFRSNSVHGGAAGAPVLLAPTAGDGSGGGIAAFAVFLEAVDLSANAAVGGVGGTDILAPDGVRDGGVARGGAVAASSVTVVGSNLSDNRADGGGAFAPAQGGALAADVVDVSNSSLTGNRATGATSHVSSVPGGTASGGAVSGRAVTVRTSSVIGNVARAGVGGDAYVGYRAGAGGDAAGGGVHGEAVELDESDLGGNLAAGGDPGAPSPYTTPALPGRGRGGAVDATGSLLVNSTTMADDTAVGGRYLGFLPGPGLGDELASDGDITVVGTSIGRSGAATTASTIEGSGAVAVTRSGLGGNLSLAVNGATSVSLTDTTVAPASFRSGVAPVTAHDLELVATTIVLATVAPAGGPVLAADRVSVTQSLLTGRSGSVTCRTVASATQAPVVTSAGGNVARDASGTCGIGAGAGDLSADDPAMGALSAFGDHGGTTPSVAPLGTNPAVDLVAGQCATLVDQRGVSRPQGPACDAGAVELDAAVLHGTVRSAVSGEPAGGVTVSLVAAHPGWFVVATTRTDAGGSYRFEGMPAGEYAVRYFDGYGRFARQWWVVSPTYLRAGPLPVEPGATTVADADLEPRPSGIVHGEVRDGSGGGLAGIRVRVFSTTDGYVGGAVTGADGYYQLNGLPAGDYQVQLVDPSHTYLSRWYGGAVNHPNAATVTVGTGPTWASVVLR